MPTYIITHDDADGAMFVQAETAPSAKYKNYLDWRAAFNQGNRTFIAYLNGVRSCKKIKEE